MRLLRFLMISLCFLIAAGRIARGADETSPTEASASFESQVRPVLVLCYTCHSDNNEEGGLRLDAWEAISRGGASKKPAVVPGDPENSPLIQIFKQPAPADGSKNPHHLQPAQLEVLTTWIRGGAYYPPPMPEVIPQKLGSSAKKFWSFVPPLMPSV